MAKLMRLDDATALRLSAVVGKPAVPGVSPEEHKRRGDAADALWRELVRRATGG